MSIRRMPLKAALLTHITFVLPREMVAESFECQL